MIYSFIVIFLLTIISAISKAIMDKLQFHYDTSVFKNLKQQEWWNPTISYKNKYKKGEKNNGPAFFGSTTIFVFLTDAWHFFQSIFLNALFLAIMFSFNICVSLEHYHWILGFFGLKILYGLIFELFFSRLLKIKNNV